jgi:O-antigen ligase
VIARLPTIALWGLLLLALVISPVLGLLTPYAALLIIVPLFVVMLARRNAVAAYASYDARVLLGAFVLFAIVCAVTADEPKDALRAFNFTMFLTYGAVALFLDRQQAKSSAELVARFAGIGVILGLIEILASAALMHVDRPQGVNLGPIVLANALLALGFISLGGIFVRRDRLGWLYLMPPLLAIVATAITGSRGPLIAVPAAAIAAALFLWHDRFRQSLRATVLGAVGMLVLLTGGIFAALHGRAGSILTIVGAVSEGGPVADEQARQRLVLYKAGWQSFTQSPWIGHGWGNIMSSVKPFLAESDQWLLTWLPQLHNDVLNFAVASGIVGVIAYILIVTVPIVGAILGPRDSLRTFRLYGATVLTIVYIGGGLTDLMFGFEFHTYLFAMLTAILLHFCRERTA